MLIISASFIYQKNKIKCLAFRDGILATKNKGFLDLEVEGDSKIVIDYNNKKNNIPSIMLLMEDIWRLSQDLNIYVCRIMSI